MLDDDYWPSSSDVGSNFGRIWRGAINYKNLIGSGREVGDNETVWIIIITCTGHYDWHNTTETRQIIYGPQRTPVGVKYQCTDTPVMSRQMVGWCRHGGSSRHAPNTLQTVALLMLNGWMGAAFFYKGTAPTERDNANNRVAAFVLSLL